MASTRRVRALRLRALHGLGLRTASAQGHLSVHSRPSASAPPVAVSTATAASTPPDFATRTAACGSPRHCLLTDQTDDEMLAARTTNALDYARQDVGLPFWVHHRSAP
jgi:hypothetical protein